MLLHLLSNYAHDSLGTGVSIVSAIVAMLVGVLVVGVVTMAVLLRRQHLREQEEEQLEIQMREMDNSFVHANISFLNNSY